MGKVLDLNTNLILLGSLRTLFGGHYSLVFSCVLSNCQHATFHSEVKNRQYRVFLDCKKRERVPTYSLLQEFVRSCLRCFTKRRKCFEGTKEFSFQFCKPFSFKFWVLGKLESDNI